MDIYKKYKNIAINFLDVGDYEAALGMTSAVASLMYRLNCVYVDEDLEGILKKAATDYIIHQNGSADLRRDTVVFYDEFGFDTRGIALIYLKALCENRYNVIYITRSYREGKFPLILELLEQNKNNKIIYLRRGSYKEETQNVLQIIGSSNASAVFVYDYPQGIVGSLVPNVLQGTGVISYKINLTDHAFWLGARATDYVIEFRDFGASISKFYRGIEESRLIKLPYIPYIDESVEFQGFPFEVGDKKVIFSGGELYKTIGEGNLYYKLVETILIRYPDVLFWYAGNGDSTQLTLLMEKFPERVFHTEERRDLYQVMKHCYFYLNTYPIVGGLMVQYAVKAGKIPMTLLHGDEGKGVLLDAEALKCEYKDMDELLEQVDRIMVDLDYLRMLETNTGIQIISWKSFSDNIRNILNVYNTDYNIVFQKQDLYSFVKIYIKKFDVNSIRKIIYTKRTEKMLNSICDEVSL